MAAESSESSSARRAALRAFCSALGVAAALTFSAPRSDAQTDSANPLSEAVVASIDKLFLENRPAEAPGCAVGAALGERVLIRRGYGLADMEHGAPITPDTPFLTASVAKQVTAFAIQLLVEDGRLSLDDDVRRFVPELPQFEGGPITLRHLLNQTSGVRDAFVLLYLAGWRYDDVFTQDDVLRMTFRQSALNAPPGAQWSYSNTNYILLGEVVRRVSGKTLPDFAQERIFGPLGMTNSRLVDEYGALVAHRARSYVAKDDGYVNYAASDSVAGSSNFVTTINDVMLWQRNLSTGRVGGPRVVQRMAEIGRLNDGGATSYASGLFVRDYRGARSVDHGGALPGYRAQLLRLPEHDFSVSVLCNASDRNAGFLARRVADLLIGDRLAPGEPQSAPELETSAPVDRGTLRAYVGEYRIAPNVPVKVTLEGASLFLQMGSGSPQRLRPLSPHEFHAPELGRLTFSEQAGAPMQIALMRFGQNQIAHRRTTLTARAAARYVGVYYSSELDAIYRIAYRDGRLWLDHRRGAAEMIQAGPDTFATLTPLDFECRNDRTYCAPFATLRFSCSAPGDCAGLALSTERVSNLAFRRASLP